MGTGSRRPLRMAPPRGPAGTRWAWIRDSRSRKLRWPAGPGWHFFSGWNWVAKCYPGPLTGEASAVVGLACARRAKATPCWRNSCGRSEPAAVEVLVPGVGEASGARGSNPSAAPVAAAVVLQPAFQLEALDAAGDEAETGGLLLAVVQQHLHANADAQHRFVGGGVNRFPADRSSSTQLGVVSMAPLAGSTMRWRQRRLLAWR